MFSRHLGFLETNLVSVMTLGSSENVEIMLENPYLGALLE